MNVNKPLWPFTFAITYNINYIHIPYLKRKYNVFLPIDENDVEF